TTPAAQPVSQVAVISYGLWMRRYGGDRSMIIRSAEASRSSAAASRSSAVTSRSSRTIALDGVPTAVIGIMPPQFAFPDARVDAWIPEQVRRELVWDTFMHAGVARLRPGASVDDARRELSGLIADLPNVYPDDRTVSGFLHNLGMRSNAQT